MPFEGIREIMREREREIMRERERHRDRDRDRDRERERERGGESRGNVPYMVGIAIWQIRLFRGYVILMIRFCLFADAGIWWVLCYCWNIKVKCSRGWWKGGLIWLVSLYSVHYAPSYEPKFTLIAQVCTELAYLSMLILRWPALPALSAGHIINKYMPI